MTRAYIALFSALFRIALRMETNAVRLRDFAQHRKMRAVQRRAGPQSRHGW